MEEEKKEVNTGISHSEPESSSKYEFPWRGFGFLRKFKKPPTGSHTSHPAPISHKKLPKSKSKNSTKSLPPGLPSQLDPDFYCFESSWLNFTLFDLQKATNNFSRGTNFLHILTLSSFGTLDRFISIFHFQTVDLMKIPSKCSSILSY